MFYSAVPPAYDADKLTDFEDAVLTARKAEVNSRYTQALAHVPFGARWFFKLTVSSLYTKDDLLTYNPHQQPLFTAVSHPFLTMRTLKENYDLKTVKPGPCEKAMAFTVQEMQNGYKKLARTAERSPNSFADVLLNLLIASAPAFEKLRDKVAHQTFLLDDMDEELNETDQEVLILSLAAHVNLAVDIVHSVKTVVELCENKDLSNSFATALKLSPEGVSHAPGFDALINRTITKTNTPLTSTLLAEHKHSLARLLLLTSMTSIASEQEGNQKS